MKERGAYKRVLPILNRLTPKYIIMNAIKDRLEGTGIIKLVLIFDIITDKYTIHVSKNDNSSMKLNIEKDEITLLKKLFINKVERKYRESSDKDIKAVIVQLNFEADDIQVFIEDSKENVEKFEYKL